MKNLITFINEKQNFLIKGHTIDQLGTIDLDLPSDLKWATCNIGASKPEEPGLLFQWGRLDGYKYEDNNSKFLSEDDYTTTSNTEYKKGDILKPEDDIAYQSTKGKFRMPTGDEIDELRKYTNNEWTELNGINGRKFMSKKDNSKWIFIPAAGYFNGFDGKFYDFGSNGYLWTSSATTNYSDRADYLCFDDDYCNRNYFYRDYGHSVRGVLNK